MRADEMQLYDIVDMPHIPWWQQPWFYLLIVFVIFCLGLFLWLLYKFLTRKRHTPFDRAMREIERIQLNKLRSQEDQKKYYSNLSRLLKRFLFEQFGYKVEGQTDHELLLFLENQELPIELQEEVGTLLEGLDAIKFADQEAALERMRADYARMVQILIRSKELSEQSNEGRGA